MQIHTYVCDDPHKKKQTGGSSQKTNPHIILWRPSQEEADQRLVTKKTENMSVANPTFVINHGVASHKNLLLGTESPSQLLWLTTAWLVTKVRVSGGLLRISEPHVQQQVQDETRSNRRNNSSQKTSLNHHNQSQKPCLSPTQLLWLTTAWLVTKTCFWEGFQAKAFAGGCENLPKSKFCDQPRRG